MILLDNDGVMCDLHTPLMNIHRFKMQDWKPGVCSIEEVTGLTAKAVWNHPEVTHKDFWASLPKTPWADDLLALLRRRTSEICFLTKPVLDPGCAAGKMRWFKKHYPGVKFLIGTSKKFCAGPGKILIDDSEENVDEFNEYGGRGILFPRVWNKLHSIGDPLAYIADQL